MIALAVFAGAARGCHALLQAIAVADRWDTDNFAQINPTFNAPTALSALAPVTGPAFAGALASYVGMAVLMAGLLLVVTIASSKT